MDNIKDAWKVFSDVWAFYKEFWEVSGADEYWENVVTRADKLYKEEPSPLKRALLNAVVDDMERRLKESGR